MGNNIFLKDITQVIDLNLFVQCTVFILFVALLLSYKQFSPFCGRIAFFVANKVYVYTSKGDIIKI